MKIKYEVTAVGGRVAVAGGFWGELLRRNHGVTLPHVLEHCEKDGDILNLEIAAGLKDGEYAGGSHEDSDLFKALEGAAYCLGMAADAELDARLDALVELIAAAQEADGYFSTYYSVHKQKKRYSDLHRSHELYCVGHLIEAAVAYFEATGKRTLLDVAVKAANHLDATFGPGKLETVPGHQELELALVKLYKTTGEKRYLELSRYFVDMRGNLERVRREYAGKPILEGDRRPGRNRPPEYRQDHLPAVDQREPVGHAVRAGYFYAAMADIARECGSREHAAAVDALWDSIVGKHLYITGGVGTHQHHDEGFGDAYRLPNDAAYCETCGGIALLLFSHRMNLLNSHARYADVIEIILYNHLLSCTDLAGVNFNYRNPLQSDGSRQRRPWQNPACCPTNIVRTIPQIRRFAYAAAADALYIDQFVSSTAELQLGDGKLRVTQSTEYPWDGRVDVLLQPEAPRKITLHIRIPGWVDGRPVPSDLYAADQNQPAAASIVVNGEPVDSSRRCNGYWVIRRLWQPGDRISINFPMPVRRVYANERVQADRGRVALMRGPLVYCLEGADHDEDLQHIVLPDTARLRFEYRADLLNGARVIRNEAGAITAVPYFAWNNREPGWMTVWIPRG